MNMSYQLTQNDVYWSEFQKYQMTDLKPSNDTFNKWPSSTKWTILNPSNDRFSKWPQVPNSNKTQ
jgi:hypothetical protein